MKLRPIDRDTARSIARFEGMRSAFMHEYATGRRSVDDLLLFACAMHDELSLITKKIEKLDQLRFDVQSAVAHYQKP